MTEETPSEAECQEAYDLLFSPDPPAREASTPLCPPARPASLPGDEGLMQILRAEHERFKERVKDICYGVDGLQDTKATKANSPPARGKFPWVGKPFIVPINTRPGSSRPAARATTPIVEDDLMRKLREEHEREFAEHEWALTEARRRWGDWAVAWRDRMKGLCYVSGMDGLEEHRGKGKTFAEAFAEADGKGAGEKIAREEN